MTTNRESSSDVNVDLSESKQDDNIENDNSGAVKPKVAATTATAAAAAANFSADEPDLEYDDEIGSLVAEQQEDDDEIDEILLNLEEQKLGNGQFTHESLIDEDFEAELGDANRLSQAMNIMDVDAEVATQRAALRERIDRYGIVKVCNSDLQGRPVIVISACKLPTAHDVLKEDEFFKSHQHFFDVLADVITSTLEKYVESEYTLVYFHHGLQRSNQPSMNWLARYYRFLDRKFKKNLKALYIIHPTYLVKLISQLFRTLVSSKFHKKVNYFNTLSELGAHGVDLNSLAIPDEVKFYDAQLTEKKKQPPAQTSASTDAAKQQEYGKFQQFKVPLEIIAQNNNGDCVPLCLKETFIYLRQHLDEEGIFRKSGHYERIKEIQRLYNMGEPVAYDQSEVHVAACVLKAFFRELPESLLPDSIFNELMSLQALDTADKVEVARDLLKAKLPKYNYVLLKELIKFLSEVAQHSANNKMDAKNISYVFGPNFLSKNANSINATSGQQQQQQQIGLIDIERINNFVELLIRFHAEIFSNID